MGVTKKVVELGAHERMTVAQALGITEREAPSEVLILFTDAEGDFGLRSSGMANKDALWLIKAGEALLIKEAFGDD